MIQYFSTEPFNNHTLLLCHNSNSFALSIFRTSSGHFPTVYIGNNEFLCTSLWLCQLHCNFRFYFCSVTRSGIISCSSWFFNISFLILLNGFTLSLIFLILELICVFTNAFFVGGNFLFLPIVPSFSSLLPLLFMCMCGHLYTISKKSVSNVFLIRSEALYLCNLLERTEMPGITCKESYIFKRKFA